MVCTSGDLNFPIFQMLIEANDGESSSPPRFSCRYFTRADGEMSVPDLVCTLARKIVFEDDVNFTDEQKAGLAVAAVAQTRKRKKLEQILRRMRWLPFEKLLSIKSSKDSLAKSIRENLLAAEVELQESKIDVTKLVQRVLERNDTIGPKITHILLLLRRTSCGRSESKLNISDWWNIERLSRPQLDFNPDDVGECLVEQSARSTRRQHYPYVTDEKDKEEKHLIHKVLAASTRLNRISIPLSGLDQADMVLMECDVLLEQHQTSTSLISRTFCHAVKEILSEVSGEVIAVRKLGLTSLLSIETQARPLIGKCEAVKHVLLSLNIQPENVESCCTYVDALRSLMAQCETTSGPWSKYTVARRLHTSLLRTVAEVLGDFLSSSCDGPFPSDFAYENVSAKDVMPIPHPDDCKWILTLPKSLGGVEMSQRCSFARELGSRFLEHFAVAFGETLSENSLKMACTKIEMAVMEILKSRLLKEVSQWHHKLLYRKSDDEESDKKDVSSLFPQELVRILERCMLVLSTIEHVQAKCKSHFEMFHLMRGLYAFLAQSIDFDIFARLQENVQKAQQVEEILEAIEAVEDDLKTLFFFDDDIRFLTLEKLIDAAETYNLEKFRKCRSFFVRCLMNTPNGRYFLDAVDQNGFYSRTVGVSE